MDIQLNFINNSNDTNNSEIVIFQKNVATGYDEIAVAWKVIKNCGQGWYHPFTYPMDLYVKAADSYNNSSPQLLATNGELFEVVENPSGDMLQLSALPSSNPNEIDVLNSLKLGSIDANIYKDGRLLATKTGIAPQQKAVFQFKPQLFIGVASQIQEGQVMNSAILSQINTNVNLFGIVSADIVMRGGGSGPKSTPFTFSLENMVYA